MKTKIKDDLDLHEEDFVDDDMLLGFGNDAVKEAHKEYVKRYECGLETEAALSLVSGTDTYALPSDIYETKITLIQYNDGSTIYEIKELKEKRDIPYVQTNDDYRYRIINTTAAGPKIKLYPTSRETSSSVVTVHYIRTAKEIALDADTVDLPGAADFIIQHIKDSVRNKEAGTLYAAEESPALKKQRALMEEALSDMTPDGDNMLQGDYSFYDEFDQIEEM